MTLLQTIRNRLAGRTRAAFAAGPGKSQAQVWFETVNPLSGLTIPRAVQIFDQARHGCYAQLQWLYQEIEAADPTLLVCTERRSAGVAEIDWKIETLSAARAGRGRWDETLAAEQQAYLEGAIGACGNLLDGFEHLGCAFFRGFAHAAPRYSPDGLELREIETLDAWNFCLDRASGAWLWNPDCKAIVDGKGLEAIPDDELLTLRRTRHIDYPALAIYIRAALGEAQWGRFMERYGIPPVMIVMPEFADETDETRYMEAADKVARGGSGALPYGSTVTYATEARGVNPFSDYLKHQQELIVLMATGGLLTSLAEAGSGTLAGGAHEDTWESVVRRDSRVIAEAFNRRVAADLLDRAYPGRPRLARFAFDTEAAPSAGEVFDVAVKAASAGWRVTARDLRERTGYELEPAAQAAATDFADFADGGGVKTVQKLLNGNSGAPFAANKRQTPLQTHGTPLQNGDGSGDGSREGSGREAPQIASYEAAAVEALAEARAKGLAPVIDRLLDALAETDEAAMREALAGLLADLPKLAAAAGADADTGLVERILSDAVGAGYRESGTGSRESGQSGTQEGRKENP